MTQTIGSRRQVWNGTAKRTSGGLTKTDLMMSHGRIVSKSKHFSAKKEMRLLKYGYGTQKGKFGFVKIGTKKHRKGHKKMRGGSSYAPLSPADVDSSYMINDVVPQSFSPLDRALVGGRRKSRRMRGGMIPLSPADSNANYMIKDVVPQQFSPLDRALEGGRRRRKMRGGTTKQTLMPAELVGADSVQFRAGLGN
jgi:hypothetical protein